MRITCLGLSICTLLNGGSCVTTHSRLGRGLSEKLDIGRYLAILTTHVACTACSPMDTADPACSSVAGGSRIYLLHRPLGNRVPTAGLRHSSKTRTLPPGARCREERALTVIFLITCFPWDSGQGGPFILRHWVKRLDSEPIYWFALSGPAGQVPFEAPHLQCEFRAPPARGKYRCGLIHFGGGISTGFGHQKQLRCSSAESQTTSRYLASGRFRACPVGLRLLPMLHDQRAHVSIHDDPKATAQREGCSSSSLGVVQNFLNGLRDMDVSADAGSSEELLADILPQAKRSAIVTLPVDPSKCASTFVGPRKQGPLTVGFSGNFFGAKEFACFVEGLRLWSQQSGRDWQMRPFWRPDLGRFDPRVTARGFTPPTMVRKVLSDCDLLLLPSPLDRPEMRTSVPTKLVSYVEVGRMVFAGT